MFLEILAEFEACWEVYAILTRLCVTVCKSQCACVRACVCVYVYSVGVYVYTNLCIYVCMYVRINAS